MTSVYARWKETSARIIPAEMRRKQRSPGLSDPVAYSEVENWRVEGLNVPRLMGMMRANSCLRNELGLCEPQKLWK